MIDEFKFYTNKFLDENYDYDQHILCDKFHHIFSNMVINQLFECEGVSVCDKSDWMSIRIAND